MHGHVYQSGIFSTVVWTQPKCPSTDERIQKEAIRRHTVIRPRERGLPSHLQQHGWTLGTLRHAGEVGRTKARMYRVSNVGNLGRLKLQTPESKMVATTGWPEHGDKSECLTRKLAESVSYRDLTHSTTDVDDTAL